MINLDLAVTTAQLIFGASKEFFIRYFVLQKHEFALRQIVCEFLKTFSPEYMNMCL